MDVAFIPPAPPPAPSEPAAAPAAEDEFAAHLDGVEAASDAADDSTPRAEAALTEPPRPQPAPAIDAAILFTHAVAPTPTSPALVARAPEAVQSIALPSAPTEAAGATPNLQNTPELAPHAAAQVQSEPAPIATPAGAVATQAPAPIALQAAPVAPRQRAGAPSAAIESAPAPQPAADAAPQMTAAPPALAQHGERASATAPAAPIPAALRKQAIEATPDDVESAAPTALTARAAPALTDKSAPAPLHALARPAAQQDAAPQLAASPAAPEPTPQPPAPVQPATQRAATAPRAAIAAAQTAQGPALAPAETAPFDPLAAAATPAPEGAAAPSDPHTARSTLAAAPAAQVAQQIIRRIDNGATRFELRLDPPELGRVDVRLELSRDHKVTALIAADDPATLAQLTRAAREIELTLESAGLELADNGLSFDLAGGGQAERDTQRFSAGAHAAPARGPADADPPLARRALALESWRGARVDLVA